MANDKQEQQIREERLLELFTKLFNVLDITHSAFSINYYDRSKIEALQKLEKEYPELGLSCKFKPGDSVSVISLMATITDILTGKRFGVIADANPNSELRIIQKAILVDREMNTILSG